MIDLSILAKVLDASDLDVELPRLTPKQGIILFAIADRELYGWQIINVIKLVSPAFKMSLGYLYPLLQSLEEKGLVTGKWGDESSQEARRRYYHLTPLGRFWLKSEFEFYVKLMTTQV